MRGRFEYRGHRPDRRAIRRMLGYTGTSDLSRDLDARARRAETAARTFVGKDTLRLMRSIRTERGRNALGAYRDVVAGRRGGRTEYVMWHHDGTEPHDIRPRRAKALRFRIGNRIVYAARVRHPGTVGSRFLARAARYFR